MKQEIIIAGFGGQGVLSLGMTLAYAGLVEGREVSWMPSYGPEMRGGTANCTVILSTQKVSSPIIKYYDTAIILNQPSLEKFEKRVKPGGLLLYESNNILTAPVRTDIEIRPIPAAVEAGKFNKKVLNMIILGAFLGLRPVLKTESVLTALKKVLPDRHHHLIPVNKKALQRGESLVRGHLAV